MGKSNKRKRQEDGSWKDPGWAERPYDREKQRAPTRDYELEHAGNDMNVAPAKVHKAPLRQHHHFNRRVPLTYKGIIPMTGTDANGLDDFGETKRNVELEQGGAAEHGDEDEIRGKGQGGPAFPRGATFMYGRTNIHAPRVGAHNINHRLPVPHPGPDVGESPDVVRRSISFDDEVERSQAPDQEDDRGGGHGAKNLFGDHDRERLPELQRLPSSQVSPGIGVSPIREPLRTRVTQRQATAAGGTDILVRDMKYYRELYNNSQQEVKRLKRSVTSAQDASELAFVKSRDIEKELSHVKECLDMERRKECPECHFRKDCMGRAATRGIAGRTRKEDNPRGRTSILNAALEAAIRLDPENQYSGKPVILVSALHSPIASAVCAPIVSQLHPRELWPDAANREAPGFPEIPGSASSVVTMQQWWLPKLQEITQGQGTPVFEGHWMRTASVATAPNAADTSQRQVVGFVPKIPLNLARRPVDGGGMIATPGVFGAQRGDDQFQFYAGEFCKKLMLVHPLCASFSSEDVEGLARLNQGHDLTHAQVRRLHLRRLSTVKSSLRDNVLKAVGFGSLKAFTMFFAPNRVWLRDQKTVKNLMGIGGDPNLEGLPSSYRSWKKGANHSLSKWRTIQPSDIVRIREIVHRFVTSTMVGEEDVSSSKVTAPSLHVQGPDIFFGSDELRHVFAGWMGRVAEYLPNSAGADPSPRNNTNLPQRQTQGQEQEREDNSEALPGAVRGDTSVLTIARADAYMSAWLALNVRAAELRRPDERHSKRMVQTIMYNKLCQELLPHAAVGVMMECRNEMERLENCNMVPVDNSEDDLERPSGRDAAAQMSQWNLEMRVPFSMQALTRACISVNVERTSLEKLGNSHTSSDRQKFADVRSSVGRDPTTRISFSHHGLDYYMRRARKCTLHFHDADDRADYIVLKAQYVRKHICSWIGDVRDAFVGCLDAAAGKFEEIACTTVPAFGTPEEDMLSLSDMGGAMEGEDAEDDDD